MRIERWYWLPIFCALSALMHLGLAKATWRGGGGVNGHEPGTMEVTLTAPIPELKPVTKPIPKPKPERVSRPAVAHARRPALLAPYHVQVFRPTAAAVESVRRTTPLVTTRVTSKPIAPKVTTNRSAELPDSVKLEAPSANVQTAKHVSIAPLIRRNNSRLDYGGGSPSPSPIAGGHDGLAAPEAPKDVVNYDRGGGGPAVAAIPKIGGGGNQNSILHNSTVNPLGDGVPDEKPGSGTGRAGGHGSGAGGGVGSARGPGIGVQADGTVAIGTLRKKPGTGIGAASGTGIGTRAPGGGHGTGAELPGTGGTGNGYGRGHETGIGDGSDEAAPIARMRGIPFGNVAGLLGGGPGGGKGSGTPGRGIAFVPRQVGGGEGPIHIVYALDISGSMRDGKKIVKARDALKKALSELRRTDTFNIVVFKHDASTFRDDSVQATPANIANASIFVDEIKIGDGTNISAAMDLALGMNGITHILLMSDGEPNGGIGDFNELRKFIRDRNSRNVKIMTLALGLGENFPGMRLLRGIAQDNNGSFDYVNMAKIAVPKTDN